MTPLAKTLSRYVAQASVQARSVDPHASALALARAYIANASDDDEKFSDKNPDRLKVLTDPDASKLVQKLFQQYVSESDFSTLVMFIKDFDSFLGKYRDRPLTRQEIEKIEKEQEEGSGEADEDEIAKPAKRGKKKRARSEEDLDATVPTEDDGDAPDIEPEIDGDVPTDDVLEDEPSITIAGFLSRVSQKMKKG